MDNDFPKHKPSKSTHHTTNLQQKLTECRVSNVHFLESNSAKFSFEKSATINTFILTHFKENMLEKINVKNRELHSSEKRSLGGHLDVDHTEAEKLHTRKGWLCSRRYAENHYNK